jgi:hypothetical protein
MKEELVYFRINDKISMDIVAYQSWGKSLVMLCGLLYHILCENHLLLKSR